MGKYTITEYDVLTGVETTREMTDEEYQALLDSGWTPGDTDDADKPA